MAGRGLLQTLRIMGGVLPSIEPVIWLAVEDENAHMLADDVYDAFVLVPLYLAMYLKEDLHIHGKMSKRLHNNITNYLQRILCDFSPDLSRVNVIADGFAEAAGNQGIIGTGISCGVDSLTTIYDRYVMEDDPDYRINGLFFYNCGSHGKYGAESEKLFFDRYRLNKAAADDLGLPIYLINTNFHSFMSVTGNDNSIGHMARYSCLLGVQRAVRKYYISSTFSYVDIMRFGLKCRNYDFAEFSESYSIPLIRTEKCELVIDGCQYERTQKTERIASWDIARKYLNVCVDEKYEGHNCSKCGKCLRTLTAIDALGKLDDFGGVFDIAAYRRRSFRNKCDIVIHRKNDALMADNYNFARSHGVSFPPYIVAWVYLLPYRCFGLAKKALRKVMGENSYEAVKRLLRAGKK